MTMKLFTAVVGLTLAAAPLHAQGSADSLLSQRAGLDLADATLATALAALQRASGTSIAFSPELLPDAVRVTCRCRDWTIRATLRRLLTGTGLAFRATRSRVLIVPLAATRTLTGRVLGREDRRPVPGTLIRVVEDSLTTVTDGEGVFTLRGVSAVDVRLTVQRLGVAPDTIRVPAHRDSLTLYVATQSTELAPLVVVADPLPDRTRFDETAQHSTVTLAPDQITAIPGVLENDLVRSIQLLPGTVARSDFSVGYNVRGGENDQNLILLDGITVFNPTHVGGLFSTFDANAVESVDFRTGGFPARYSGRLSSVLDVKLREGGRGRVSGHGQVSLLSSKLLLDGPIGPATFVLGARRTYFDAVFAALTPNEAPYWFADIVGKVTLPIGRGGSLAATTYWGADVLDARLVDPDTSRRVLVPIDFGLNWGNRLGGLTWRQLVGRGTLTAALSRSEFESTLQVSPSFVRFANHVRLTSGRGEYTTPIGTSHRLTAGAGVEAFRIRYEFDEPQFEFGHEGSAIGTASTPIGFQPAFNRVYRPTVWSVFVEDRWRPSPRFTLRPGLRVEHVAGAGFIGIAPRVAAKYYLDRDQAVTASVGRYYQPIHSLHDQDLPFTIYEYWIGADERVPVARSDHIVLGYERWFGREWQIVTEAYRKTFDRLIIPNRAITLRSDGDEFLPMTGNSWGVDVLLRRHAGAVRGWIGYGFNKTIRRADGQEFPPSHDRRHTVNVVLEAPGPLGATLGLRWTYGAPLPFTGFVGEWNHRQFRAGGKAFDQGDAEPISLGINDQRLPSYQRLDAGLRWRFGSSIEWRPYLQVANAYNRRNVSFYLFEFGRPPTRTGISQLPVVPTFGLELSW